MSAFVVGRASILAVAAGERPDVLSGFRGGLKDRILAATTGRGMGRFTTASAGVNLRAVNNANQRDSAWYQEVAW